MVSLQERLTRPLPDLWDWEPVQWGEWSPPRRSTLLLHMPAEAMACEKCGTVDENLVAFGKRPARPSMGQDRPLRDLYAYRCRHCGHDTVTDQRTGEHWDLDESDYGITGSNPPAAPSPTPAQEALF